MMNEAKLLEIQTLANNKNIKLLSANYTNSLTFLLFECSIHGQFEQTSKKFKKSITGCSKCSHSKRADKQKMDRTETEAFLKSCHVSLSKNEKKETYGAKEKIEIDCPTHGTLKTTIGSLKKTNLCPKCAKIEGNKKHRSVVDNKIRFLPNFVKESRNARGDRVFIFKCPKHGEYKRKTHQLHKECGRCVDERLTEKRKTPIGDVLKILDTRGYKLLGEFKGQNYPVLLSCPKHDEFKMRIGDIKNGHQCPRCSCRQSAPQDEIFDFVKSLGFKTERNIKSILENKRLELDIYVPSKNFAIEYNGIYWHSASRRGKNHLKDKMTIAARSNISILNIYDYEYATKKPQILQLIKAKLGQNPKLNARDCQLKQIEKKEVDSYLNANHIQGTVPFLVAYGLFHKTHGLIAVMTGGRHHRGNEKSLVLSRFCQGEFQVRGGASKLLKELVRFGAIEKYENILSWSDNRWSNGGLYESIGFTLDGELSPDYIYFKGEDVFSKQSCTKKALLKKGAIGNTELEMSESLGYARIYDCGKKRWILPIP